MNKIFFRHQERSEALSAAWLTCNGIATPSMRARNDGVGLPSRIMGLPRLFLRLAMTIVGILMATGCSDKIDGLGVQGGASRETKITISFMPVPENGGLAGTRAITDDMNIDEGTAPEYMVEDLWLAEYDNAGNRIGMPVYYTKSKLTAGSITLPVTLPTQEDVTYKLVAIANTHREVFNELMQATTLQKLKEITLDATNESQLFNPEVKDVRLADLIMNGVVDLTIDGGDQICRLYRNIAKLTVTLSSAANSNVTITHVRLCNVPDKVFYADRLFNSQIPFPTTEQTGMTSYQTELFETPVTPGSSTASMTFYLPRNMRGETPHSNESQKVEDEAPKLATYIELTGVKTAEGTPLRYTFYVGENMTNNYNVIPNHHYTIPIEINSVGNVQTDPRVHDMGLVELAISNCYIINPLPTESQQVFKVPTERILQFWTMEMQESENSLQGRWVAEVIWQDQPRTLLHFCNKDGSIPVSAVAANVTGATQDGLSYQGVGCPSYFYFKPNQGASGNVLVGVRRANETGINRKYLWSWHLWITDYDPDSAPQHSAWSNEYEYQLSSNAGRVLHFADGPGSNLWETAYRDAMIMDRNLGAMSEYPIDDDYWPTAGMCYYWGRKDPIPPSYTGTYYPKINQYLYGITGEPQTVFEPEAGSAGVEAHSIRRVVWTNENQTYPSDVGYNTMVNYPYTLYSQFGNGLRGPYTAYPSRQSGLYYQRLWNSPSWYEGELLEEEGKSLFDPCPPGWQLTHPDTWSILMTGSHNVAHMNQSSQPLGDTITIVANTPTTELFDGRYGLSKTKGIECWYTATGSGPKLWLSFCANYGTAMTCNIPPHLAYYNNSRDDSGKKRFESVSLVGFRLLGDNPNAYPVRCVKVQLSSSDWSRYP